MKYLLVLLLALNFTAHAAHKINIDIVPNQDLTEKMLTPLWKTIPYEYELPNKNIYSILGNTITFELINSKITLGPKLHPLFHISFTENDKFILNWDFSRFTAFAKAKIRFKYNKYGVNITHDEYFNIKAERIGESKTTVGIKYANPSFKIKLISNQGFELQNVDIKPQDGIGQVLRFIFDNIFSKSEVDAFITKSVNAELNKWINNNTLISEVENSLNQEVIKAQNTNIKLSDIANHLKININKITFNESLFSLGIEPEFNQEELVVHPCAAGMLTGYNKDQLDTSHSVVEKMLNNYNTYEIWDHGKLIEPLFCFGYQEYDEGGNPLGELAEAQFLGKTIGFKYWVRPESAPMYEYLAEENMVKVSINMSIDLKDTNYPIIRASNNKLTSKLIGYFKINFDPQTGLNLDFIKFQMPSITGSVKVKWNRFTPFIPVPLNIVRSSIETFINKAAEENMQSINLVLPEFEFMENIFLEIESYNMTEDSHQIRFRTK